MSQHYRRIYSHYSFIYPNQHYKNVVIELTKDNRIIRIFPFEKEIEDTEFYSGRVFYLPVEVFVSDIDMNAENKAHTLSEEKNLSDNITRMIYDAKGFKL